MGCASPTPTQALNNAIRGNLLLHFVQNLEPYHPPVSQLLGTKGFLQINYWPCCRYVTPTSSAQFNRSVWQVDLSILFNLLLITLGIPRCFPPALPTAHARDEHNPC